MKVFFLLMPLLFCGCIARSAYVDETDKKVYNLLDYMLKGDLPAQPALNDLKEHIREGSSVKIPPAAVGLADGLVPGAGVVLTTLLGMYARRKHNETQHVTKRAVQAANEPDPAKARAKLSDDPKINFHT